MSIKANVQDIMIPSEERHLRMYPMDFEEFLWGMGNETLMDYIRLCFKSGKPMGQALHRKAMDYFRQYLIIGGMPQAVTTYADTRDFEKVDRIKRDILELYRADIVKHAKEYEMKVEQIFDDIPAQLQKHEKNSGQNMRNNCITPTFCIQVIINKRTVLYICRCICPCCCDDNFAVFAIIVSFER